MELIVYEMCLFYLLINIHFHPTNEYFSLSDINECALNPCLNGGSCINNFGSYVCICLTDYTGPNCIQTAFKVSFPTLDLTYTPDLAFNTSSKFQRHAQLFCNDINNLMSTHRNRFPDYEDCVVTAFKDNPTRMEWELKFKGNVPPGTIDNAKGLIFEAFPRRIYGDSLGIEIGDILFFLDDYKLTKVSIPDAMLLNFTRSPEFDNNRSIEFQTNANLLCADVDTIMKNNADRFPNYVECKVNSFPVGPDGTPMVNYEISFEGDQNPAQLKEDFNNILLRDLPKERFDRWLGYRLGDLLVYYQNFTDFTEVPLKFRVLNLTFSNDLYDSSSPRFRLHAERFCMDIDRLLNGRKDLFPTYEKCKVERFGNNPVNIEILLEFMGQLSIPEMQQLVATVIFEDTPRYRYEQVVGHLIGDLLVYYADLLLYNYNVPFGMGYPSCFCFCDC
ncbi:NOTC2-like protein [Mya arenaria]|uniref:NOTC2-like protein n=1 Tax=Mya arenaria TaxID=6604 RepID=A0ABY7G5G6_MYAAR|nr:NOTC2-like protein [Mya arenaria]